ncbi:hypothetical protein DPMN_049053 [Dreissena polymorpha]|uniref:Uncharacterized protein n=1 Tax=Dreissena polymorpha TaxID=45954 RepID=A0A9D4I2Y1_DREPO|nr:hypothetical protein DPMN_049053 [Dreissena polymorpha]
MAHSPLMTSTLQVTTGDGTTTYLSMTSGDCTASQTPTSAQASNRGDTMVLIQHGMGRTYAQ